MKHRPEDHERTAMREPESIPPRVKARAGRTPTAMTPVVVHGHQVSIEKHHGEYVREKLGHKLGKFAPAIERIVVRFEDVNGPKGGDDHVCRMQVNLSGMGVIVVEEIAVDPITAFDLAAQRLVHAVEHRLGRVRRAQVPAQRKARQQSRAALPTLVDDAKPRAPKRRSGRPSTPPSDR